VSKESYVCLIQKVWRGWSVRNWILLAGPGVLRRSICHNAEELVSLNSKESVHPFSYFSFEEAGKVYWFDVRSLSEYTVQLEIPLNPYTRQPLQMEVRQRLRQLCTLRYRRKISNVHEIRKVSIEEGTMFCWRQLSQILEENGFDFVNPRVFETLNYNTLLHLILIDISALITSNLKQYKKYFWSVRRLIGNYPFQILSGYRVSTLLLSILNDCVKKYEISFIIMSALYRM